MNLQGKRVAVLVEKTYEDLELWYPAVRLQEAGATVTLVGPKAGETYPSKHGYPARADKAVADVSAADFDGAVVPGGFSPDHMRRDPKFREPCATPCWPASRWPPSVTAPGCCARPRCAGRRATSFFSIREDMENAGAAWVDEAVVVDGPVITSRTPADLVPFTVAFMKALAG